MDSFSVSSSSPPILPCRDDPLSDDEEEEEEDELDDLSQIELANEQQMRDCQRSLFERSINTNLLISLSNQTDKSQIAINLIKYMLHQTDGAYPEVARRTMFIAPTQALLEQQFEAIQSDVSPAYKVAKLHDANAKQMFKSKDDWVKFFAANRIVCITPSTLNDAICKGAIDFHNLNLMIIEQADRVLPTTARSANPYYRQLMFLYGAWMLKSEPADTPRILGLCDSLFSTAQIEPNDVLPRIKQFEEVMHAKYTDDTASYIKQTKVFTIEFGESLTKHAILLDIFRVFQSSELNCIVFVQERAESISVYEWLCTLKHATSGQYAFLKPGIVCGPSWLWWFSEKLADCKRLFARKQVNVLIVATSYLQEVGGFDQLPDCNVIVQYDLPMNFREFVQWKSLVRDSNGSSYYLLLIDLKQEKGKETLDWKAQLDNFFQLEQFLKHSLNVVPYRTKSGTELTEQNAHIILQKYVINLPLDFFIESKPNMQLLTKLVNPNERKYAYQLIWPLNCTTMKGTVLGEYRLSMKAAKANCAYAACEALYEAGELDEQWNVLSSEFSSSKHALELNLKYWKDPTNPVQKSTKNHLSTHERAPTFDYMEKLKLFPSCSSRTQYFLYVIDFTNYYSLFGLSESVETIGFLTAVPLPCPAIESLIYLNQSRIKFSIRLVAQSIVFDQDTHELISLFHSHVIEHVIHKPLFRKPKQEDESTEQQSSNDDDESTTLQQPNNFLLVPIQIQNSSNKYEINLTLIKSLHKWHDQCRAQQKSIKDCSKTQRNLEKNESFAQNNLFTVINSKGRLVIYEVQSVSNVLPTDLVESSHDSDQNEEPRTYIQLFRDLFNFEIVHRELPMLSACVLEHILRHSWRFHITNKMPSDKPMREPRLFPAEFVLRYPLSLQLFRLFNAFPPIAYRLEQFLLAEQFFCQMSGGIELDYEHEIDLETLLTEQTVCNLTKREDCDDKSTKQTNNNNNKIPSDYIEQVGSRKRAKVEEFTAKTVSSSTSSQLNLKVGSSSSAHTFVGDIEPHIGSIRFDTYDRLKWPNPWYIAKALTLAMSADLWNMKQLETVGDVYLKMSTSLYLYFRYPTYDEDKLTQLKCALVSADNLYKLALEQDNIAPYIKSERLSINFNWFVPFYTTDSVRKLVARKKSTRRFKNKSITGCVQALVGAFCLFGSTGSVVRFLEWLGLVAFEPSRYKASELISPNRYFQSESKNKNNFDDKIQIEDHQLDMKIAQPYKVNLETMVEEMYHSGHFAQVERVIGYSFKHRYFLLQAFTHQSYIDSNEHPNQYHIANYQRLEFIGNEVLDYLITYFVHQRAPCLSPMKMSHLRSTLHSNSFYASIVVKYGLHKYLRISSDLLNEQIDRFLEERSKLLSEFDSVAGDDAFDDGQLVLFENKQQLVSSGIGVPKILVDIFEALVGAIYLDNGLSMDALWRVVYRMIKVELDYFMQHIPRNPLEWLNSVHQYRYYFTDMTPIQENEKGSHQIELIIEPHMNDLDGEIKQFVGFGQSEKQCRLSAAKQAMEFYLKSEAK